MAERRLFGRIRERQMLDDLLERGDSSFASLVVTGPPGIGRTALLDHAMTRARSRGMRVLSAKPDSAEADLPFVSVYDLTAELDAAMLEDWPVLSRRALHDVPVDLTSPAAARLVGPALHALVRGLAVDEPVLLAVDDLHLLDPGSVRALVFTLRRLRDEPVAFIGTAPTPGDVPDRLLELCTAGADGLWDVGPLEEPAMTGLVRSRSPLARCLPLAALRNLHAIARGNPSVAAAILDETGRRGPFPGRLDRWPLPESLAASAVASLAELPDTTRALLAACAAMFRPDVETAAAITGLSADDLAPALERGVVRVTGARIVFADPMVPSALYAQTAAEERQDLHARLARAGRTAQERAQHLALTAGPADAGAASLLDAVARSIGNRGAPATAAVLAEAAARLTPDSDRTAAMVRRRNAASFHVRAGDPHLANLLLERVVAEARPGQERAAALSTLARVRASLGYLSQAQVLLEVAGRDTDDGAIHSVVHRDLAWTSMLMGHPERGRRHARAATELARAVDAPGVLASAQASAALLTLPTGGSDRLAENAAGPVGDVGELPLLCRPQLVQALGNLRVGNLRRADDGLRAAERDLVIGGDDGATPLVRTLAAELHCVLGTWRQADLYAQDAVDSATGSGFRMLLPWALSVRALVDAHRGDVADARAAASEGLEAALALGAGSLAALNQAALGFLELSVGNAAGAHRRLEPLTGELDADLDPALCPWVADAVTALIALKRVDDAELLLRPFEERAMALGRPLQELAAARCRGLLLAADGRRGAGIGHLTATLERLARVPAPFDQARTRLVVGQLLRRDRRLLEARGVLVPAAEAFDRLGAPLWATRARTELAATGLPAAGPFTTVEQAVVDLVTKGHSNGEVAALLYVSTRTVEAHLSSIYRKAGVRGRGQLVYHLAAGL